MKHRNHKSTNTTVIQVPDAAELDCEINCMQNYRGPELFTIGKATNLLQGNMGGYWDSDGSQSGMSTEPRPW